MFMKTRIYLDHAATTAVDPRVHEAFEPFLLTKYGNASSLHSFGQEAKEAIEKARGIIAKVINAKPSEIIFTSGGTESDNMALKGVFQKGARIITSKIEHDAVLDTCRFLEGVGGDIRKLSVDNFGFIDPLVVSNEINKKTAVVSIMHANNEIGTINDIREFGKICEESGVPFHTDAVQTFGKIPIDVKRMRISMLSASGHKIYGPKGIGFLYKREDIKLMPLLHGGGHENGLRSGTENVAGIVGMGKATELCMREMNTEGRREAQLRDYLIKNTTTKIQASWLNGHPTKRLPNNAHFGFKHIEGESIIMMLNDKGIAASTGSACSSKSLEPSHVLLAIGLKHEDAHGSLRITLGRKTTKTEIDYLTTALPPIIERLRQISPLTKKQTRIEIAKSVKPGVCE